MYRPSFPFCLVNPEFFETLDKYQPTSEFLDFVAQNCGDGWKIVPGGFWSNCIPPDFDFIEQGWKIHVSGTHETAADLLRRIVPLLVQSQVAFKFCSDTNLVKLSTSKNWLRTAAGKFITIYPRTPREFLILAETCHQATIGLRGPYILTDRRYRNSKVIFYRYGGHRGLYRIDAQGLHVPSIYSPAGELIPDERSPFYNPPLWATDPCEESQGQGKPPADGVVIKNGRYRIGRALRYSSHGGLYEAFDVESQRPVIIREARPMLLMSFEMLEKQARILQKLTDCGYTPAFVDLFPEWEHLFLVQEQLNAQSLWTYAMGFALASPTVRNSEELFLLIRETLRKTIIGLQVIHDRGIVLRDFTKTNVLFTQTEAEEVKFIDFELAYEQDRSDPPIVGGTWGYLSPQQIANRIPTPHDDHYALGVLILDMIAFTAAGLPLNRPGVLLSLEQTLTSLGLPETFGHIVRNLINVDPVVRWKPIQVIEALDTIRFIQPAGRVDPLVDQNAPKDLPAVCPSNFSASDVESTISGIANYILSKTDYQRPERLWPASSELFRTNPVSIRFGATGTAFFLLQETGRVPEKIIDWIIQRSTLATCPLGLFTGLAGVALFLLEVGRIEDARRILDLSKNRDRIFERPGLYEGAAGWGLVHLHFWEATRDQTYLDLAAQVGIELVRIMNRTEEGGSWKTGSQSLLGLGFGPSGVALFLLYLYLYTARTNEEFLAAAIAGVDFDMAAACWIGDRVLMFEYKEAPVTGTKSPHMVYGSAGVGTSALRLYAVTGDEKYRTFAEKCALTVSSRFTNKLWQDWGLAGFGELLLDCFWFSGKDEYLAAAAYIAEGILAHRIFKPEGVAFLGNEMLRISCDWGLGSAGIGSFLYRLRNPEMARFLMLDKILPQRHIETKPKHQSLGDSVVTTDS